MAVSLNSLRRSIRERLVAELQNAADSFDRLIDSLRHLAVGGFQCAGASGCLVELAGQTGAIAAQDMKLLCQRAVAAIAKAEAILAGAPDPEIEGGAP